MKKIPALLFAALCAFSSTAQAAGFYIQEQSVSHQGESYAGAGAEASDASTIFYNPAGMTQLSGKQAVLSASIIVPQSRFRDTGTTAGLTAGGPGAQAPQGGNNGGDPFSPALVPAFYAASPLTEDGRYWAGIGVSAPFGLSLSYNPGWVGRYDSTKSNLAVTDIAPVFAAKITDNFSIGGGPDLQYATAQLSSALPCPNAGFGCGAAFSPATDGVSRLDGDSWAVGYNVGALWNVDKDTRVGAQYRSAVTQTLKGAATVAGLGGALAGQNGVTDASAKLKLPDIASLSLAHDVNDRLTVLGGANWYGWKNFNEIRVVFATGAPANVTPENYRDSYGLSAGAEWKQSSRLTLRGGIQYDETPTTSSRTTRTPDSDRYWLSVGASYAVTSGFSIDAAASHVFMPDANINLAKVIYGGTGASSTVDLNAKTANQINIASLQAVVRF